jgi:hypothetical protein
VFRNGSDCHVERKHEALWISRREQGKVKTVGVLGSLLGILQVVYVAFVPSGLVTVLAPNTSTHLWGQVFRIRTRVQRVNWIGLGVHCEVWDLRCLKWCSTGHMVPLVPGQSPSPVSLGSNLGQAHHRDWHCPMLVHRDI